MQNDSPKRHIGDRLAIKLLLLVAVLTGAVFLWTSQSFKSADKGHDTWVDAHGRLHVLGLILGETTLRQAETILRSRSDIALYIYPAGHAKAGMTLEAFFPSIADHTRVILVLDATDVQLKDIETRASRPHLYPNKVARMNISVRDTKLAQSLPIRELTLIPSADVSEKAIEARFGMDHETTTTADGYKRLEYPAIGLQATLAKDDVTRLHFVNPKARE
ncbi:MAG: hypothetical protein R8L58_07955 [Mariprofundaceae bacterium]